MDKTVHDKTDEKHWTPNVDDWGDEFDPHDRVVSLDPQERLGEETYCVSWISFEDKSEYVNHAGLFWSKDDAMAFAKSELAAILMALGGPQEAGR